MPERVAGDVRSMLLSDRTCDRRDRGRWGGGTLDKDADGVFERILGEKLQKKSFFVTSK